jgi:methylmalonyl-CoA/ethylmalonyl-CoA epimerase
MKTLLNVHHIGFTVKDINATAAYYIEAGWTLSEIQIETTQNAQIAFLSREGFPLFELVAPINEFSPVIKTLEKSGVTPYHICYEVEDVDATIIELRKERFLPLFEPVESNVMDNKKICYLINKSVGLIEIVNRK